MASNSKHTEWILETIDHLRRRKARPDLERICHVVRRRFGLSAAETEAKLEKLVDSEIVIKVDYKGSTSYRNAAKWRKSMLGCAVLNSTSVSIKIIEAILDISAAQINAIEANQTPNDGADESQLSTKVKVAQYATEVGVSLESLSKWLKEKCEGFDSLKSPLTVILKREIDAGRVERLMSNSYVVSRAQMAEVDENGIRPLKTVRKTEPKADTSSDDQLTVVNKHNYSDESSNDLKPTPKLEPLKIAVPAPHQPARRGRPPKNKSQEHNSPGTPTSQGSSSHSKLKRALSNGHGGPEKKIAKKSDLKKHGSPSEQACDICHLSGRNPKGQHELLLHCKDCTARAHPSCMNYFGQLAVRAYRGPWQCMDCKTCCLCQDPGFPDQMLFCDCCDKGYHMSCHQPPVNKKPSGNWECSACQLENMALQRNDFMSSFRSKNAFVNDSAPPTPAESPIPLHHMNGHHNIPTTPKHLGNGLYPDASQWTVEDVVEYITSAGFPDESKVFFEQEIDGVALLLLKRADVLKGLNLKLGPALKINRHIQGLQTVCQKL
ncbi:atherin isoform X1 [Biomphalaria glabrata]|nr:atherin isoform X1 [Biomphalaria glabrata]KAI8786736.1 atherin isoform X1 [Biomphalaria glabrata]